MAKTTKSQRAAKSGKKKQVVKPASKGRIFKKQALGFALKSMLKKKGGRTDIEIEDAPKSHDSLMKEVPLKDRAGYPLVRNKGSVDPAKWRTKEGKEIIVDFNRPPWLPDDWGQGVKCTNPKKNKKTNGGGTYTVLVSPEGKVFYHRPTAEEFYGKPFTLELGFNGQVRTAKLQAQEAIQVARASIKEIQGKKLGTDADSSLFNLLKTEDRRHLLNKDKFHFCIISARRATQVEGIRDLFMVQSQFLEAGVEPTWYVDAESLKDYKKLGLKAVVGGKLTPARNKALQDAQRMGKICVQASDDISAWEYRVGKKATEKSDDACNAAHDKAKRLILSPVAAARFILAKMRGSEGKKPKLGGVYMIASCARTFGGDEFQTQHFILGDFFVVDQGSKVRFDESMTLKEDYDFSCAHIRAHGGVLRAQRMTLRVKHYANSGGACTNRDGNGKEEQKNIAILKKKWPRAIRDHHTRKNEVVLNWPKNDDAEGLVAPKTTAKGGKKAMKVAGKAKSSRPARSSKKVRKTLPGKRQGKKADELNKVDLKCSPNAKMVPTGKVAICYGINNRMKKASGKRVHQVLGKMQYESPKGLLTYNLSDLKYDQHRGYLQLKAR